MTKLVCHCNPITYRKLINIILVLTGKQYLTFIFKSSRFIILYFRFGYYIARKLTMEESICNLLFCVGIIDGTLSDVDLLLHEFEFIFKYIKTKLYVACACCGSIMRISNI